MTSIEKIQSEYPLHLAVWNDDHKELQDLIKTKKVSSIEMLHHLICVMTIIAVEVAAAAAAALVNFEQTESFSRI